MSDIGKLVADAGTNKTNEDHHRRYAVAAALSTIAANVQGVGTHGLLEAEMEKLSKYADLIQAALKVK